MASLSAPASRRATRVKSGALSRGTIYKEKDLKKNHSVSPSPRRTRLSAEQKQQIRAHRNFLFQQWGQKLNDNPTDWQGLFDIHWELYRLERQHAWLKKAVD
jgi:hypothetical protein